MSHWFEEAQEIAHQSARTIHKKYHTYFDVDDVRQELLLWCFKRKDKIEQWLDHDVDDEEYRDGVKQLARTLNRQAEKYCRKRKAQKLGYEMRDEQFYSPESISVLLPFAYSDVTETRDTTKPRVQGSGGNPSEGGNYVVQLFDVRIALGKLDRYDYDVLQLKFDDQLSYAELAHALGVSDSTAHRKVENALRRLTNILGGANPYGNSE